ncbi:nuclear transport factor 2 family protein [Variovorax sp. EL159]|uniref:nuclear transport factor 2 family protein n=1 Tax=Variovorax sp. EL159 TaxID=1566270 RepID=UPI000887245F|nr:nuclear transport factor 2 family protein [Variovorax sp. EL159]SCX72529.1 Ketosteroid isomerase homolog [Variovorax sp. EL159]
MTRNDETIERIRQLDDERYAAMVAKDVDSLEKLLDDKLIYMHSSGVADTKATYIEGLSTGVWDYHGIDREELRHQIDGDVALMFSRLFIRMTNRGTYKEFGSHALAVWVKKSGIWRLLAVQSGGLPPVG